MTGVATSDDVQELADDLARFAAGLGLLFTRSEPRKTFSDFIRTLLSDVVKKNSWGLAEHAGHRTPRALEHLLEGAVWDADLLRDAVRDLVVTHLGSPEGILVLDDTQVIKKGNKSVGWHPNTAGPPTRPKTARSW